jgi:heptaprenyl diphosphate synthase
MELVHMVSLIHDDVIDASDLRRGKATLSNLYGNNYAIHLGDYLFAKALAVIDSYQNTALSGKLAYTSREMCRGEIEQISNELCLQQNIKRYLYRVNRKTSVLITLCFETGALVSGANQEVVNTLGRFGHYLGMAFQIADDMLNYTADEQTLGKPVGNDLQQGVVTLPLIYFLKYGKTELCQDVKRILKKETVTTDEVVYINQAIRVSKAIEYSQELVNRYAIKALQQVDKLPDNKTTEVFRQIALLYYQEK